MRLSKYAVSALHKAHLFQQSTLLLAGGLSTVRPAPLWLFSEFGAVYKYSDLLTYLLTPSIPEQLSWRWRTICWSGRM